MISNVEGKESLIEFLGLRRRGILALARIVFWILTNGLISNYREH